MARKQTSAPERPAAKDLLAAIRRPEGTQGRSHAFAELVETRPKDLDGLLKEIALDQGLDSSIRSKAVGALGREGTATALEGLRAAIAIDDPTIARRAIERLGKTGEPSDLDLLKSARSASRVTQRVIRTAQLFLSYRHGLGQYRHDTVGRTLGARQETALAIETRPLTGQAAKRRIARSHVRGVDLSDKAPLNVVCGNHDYTVFLARDAAEDGLATLAEKQSLPAVAVEENIETGIHDPIFYLMTDPIGQGRFRISGVRPSGFVALSGEGAVRDGEVDFELRATEAPFQPPVTLAGLVDAKSGAFRFKVSMVNRLLDPAQQRRRKRPVLQHGPVG